METDEKRKHLEKSFTNRLEKLKRDFEARTARTHQVRALGELFLKTPFAVDWSFSQIEVRCKNLDEVKACRKHAREVLGSWKDKMTSVYPWGETCVQVTFKDEQHPQVVIYLETTREDFPPSLKGPTCRFQQVTSTSWTYVCDPVESSQEE